jgi:hypothetical protein
MRNLPKIEQSEDMDHYRRFASAVLRSVVVSRRLPRSGSVLPHAFKLQVLIYRSGHFQDHLAPVSGQPGLHAQSVASAQGVLGGLYRINNRLAFSDGYGISADFYSHPLSLQYDRVVIGATAISYHNSLHSGRYLYEKSVQLRS